MAGQATDIPSKYAAGLIVDGSPVSGDDIATESYVDEAINDIPPVDLSSYITSAAAASTYVPYTGATSNLNLGTRTIISGAITTSGSLLFAPDNTLDIGRSFPAISRPRDIEAGRNITAGGTITATGTVTGSNLSGTNTGDQDLSSYLTSSAASSTYLALAGGALSGALNLPGGSYLESATFSQLRNLRVNTKLYIGGFTVWINATGTTYEVATNSATRMTIDATGATTFTGDTIVHNPAVGGDLTFSGTGTSNQILSTGYLILAGTSGVTLNASGVEWSRITNTNGPVFRSYIGLAATADSTPDTYFYLFGTGQCGVLANNGFKVRNQANTADTDLTAAAATFTGTITGTSAAFSALGAFGGYGTGTATLAVQALNASTVCLDLRGQSGQSAKYLRCLTSGNVELATIDQVGNLTAAAITASGLGKFGILTVATLPSAVANPYCEGNVSDALGPVIGSPVVGGGAIKASVRSNGTDWTVTGI